MSTANSCPASECWAKTTAGSSVHNMMMRIVSLFIQVDSAKIAQLNLRSTIYDKKKAKGLLFVNLF
jgi:hypothetical protein